MKSVLVAILAVFVSVAGVVAMFFVQHHFDRRRAFLEAKQQYEDILVRVDEVGTKVAKFAEEFASGSKSDAELNAAVLPLATDADFLWAEWLTRSETDSDAFVVRKVSRTGEQKHMGVIRELDGAMANATNPQLLGSESAATMKRVFLSNRLYFQEHDKGVFAAVRPIYDQQNYVTGLAVAYFSSVLNPMRDESAVSMQVYREIDDAKGNEQRRPLVEAGGRGKGVLLDVVTTRGPEHYRFVMRERESQVLKRARISLVGLCLWPIIVFAFGQRHWKLEARRFRSECFDLSNEITERREIQKTLQTLLALRERERKTVSSDIHDGFVQEVVSAQMFLEALSTRVDLSDEKAKSYLANLQHTIEQAILEGRRLVNRNQILAVDELGFLPALNQLVNRQFEKFEQDVTLRYSDELPDLDILQQRCVYRVIQEALTNVRRHSDVNEAVVSLYVQGEHFCVDIVDNGKGFDTTTVRPTSYGIQSMSQRVEALGGQLNVVSELGSGTQVSLYFPLSLPTPGDAGSSPVSDHSFPLEQTTDSDTYVNLEATSRSHRV